MTNLERVTQLAGQLGTVTISSKDEVLFMVTKDVYTIGQYEDYITIGSEDDSQIYVRENDIVSVNDDVVCLSNYTLTFYPQ